MQLFTRVSHSALALGLALAAGAQSETALLCHPVSARLLFASDGGDKNKGKGKKRAAPAPCVSPSRDGINDEATRPALPEQDEGEGSIGFYGLGDRQCWAPIARRRVRSSGLNADGTVMTAREALEQSLRNGDAAAAEPREQAPGNIVRGKRLREQVDRLGQLRLIKNLFAEGDLQDPEETLTELMFPDLFAEDDKLRKRPRHDDDDNASGGGGGGSSSTGAPAAGIVSI